MTPSKPDRSDLIVDLEELVLPEADNSSSVMSYVISVQNPKSKPKQRIDYEFEVKEESIQTADAPTYYVWMEPQQKQATTHGWKEVENTPFDWNLEALKIAAVFAMQIFLTTHNNIVHFLLLHLHVCSKRSIHWQKMFAEAAKKITFTAAHLTEYGYCITESENVFTEVLDRYAIFFSISMCRGMGNQDFAKALEQGRKMMQDLQKETWEGLDRTVLHEMKRDPSLN